VSLCCAGSNVVFVRTVCDGKPSAPTLVIREDGDVGEIDVQEVFRALDRNKDGSIGKVEFMTGMNTVAAPILNALGVDKSSSGARSKAIAELWTEADADDSGEITLVEFHDALRRHLGQTAIRLEAPLRTETSAPSSPIDSPLPELDDETMQKCFEALDQNGDGSLGKVEFMAGMNGATAAPILRALGVGDKNAFGSGKEVTAELWALADADNSGEITFDEFLDAFKKRLGAKAR